MKVKLLEGGFCEIQVGGAKCGMRFTEMIFTASDAAAMRSPHFAEWLDHMLLGLTREEAKGND